MKQIYGIHEKGVTIEVTGTTGSDRGFSLQDWIDNLYEKKKMNKSWKASNSIPAHVVLFGVESAKNNITQWILSEWKVVYDMQEEWMDSMNKKDIKGTASLDYCFIFAMPKCFI